MTAPDRQDGWVPAFEGQRPPFLPGNTVAEQHGVHSPRKVDPLARELVQQLLADETAAHVRLPAYRPAVWAWARTEAQAQLLSEYLAKAGAAAGDGVGDLDNDRVRTAYLLQHRVETRAASLRRGLGLDPLSRARLGKDVAAGQLDTARLMAELEKRDQPTVPGEVVDDGGVQ